MRRVVPVVIVILLLLAYGIAEGLWTGRWQPAQELTLAPTRLRSVPHSVGPWQGQDEKLDERQVQQADLHAHLLRRYVHAQTTETLTLLAVCGQPAPIAAHTPEICYAGNGFARFGARQRYQVETDEFSVPAEFWVERYVKKAILPEYLQIYYAWNGSGWEAVDNPLLRFARSRILYKLYVVRRLARPDEPAESDPIPRFLELFLPQLDRCLCSGA
jgi:hypothetical protein